jgi:hypothetical protein
VSGKLAEINKRNSTDLVSVHLYHMKFIYSLIFYLPLSGIHRGGKNRRALLAGNVKQLQEIRLNEDLLLKI